MWYWGQYCRRVGSLAVSKTGRRSIRQIRIAIATTQNLKKVLAQESPGQDELEVIDISTTEFRKDLAVCCCFDAHQGIASSILKVGGGLSGTDEVLVGLDLVQPQ